MVAAGAAALIPFVASWFVSSLNKNANAAKSPHPFKYVVRSGVSRIGFWRGRLDILGVLAVFRDREVGDMGYDAHTRPSI